MEDLWGLMTCAGAGHQRAMQFILPHSDFYLCMQSMEEGLGV